MSEANGNNKQSEPFMKSMRQQIQTLQANVQARDAAVTQLIQANIENAAGLILAQQNDIANQQEIMKLKGNLERMKRVSNAFEQEIVKLKNTVLELTKQLNEDSEAA